jgi:hypothetical protein
MRLVLSFFLILHAAAAAGKYYVYVGLVDSMSVLLAWGTTNGRYTIGRSSPSHGPAEVRIGGGSIQEAHRNWVEVKGLQPDTDYPYEVRLRGEKIGSGVVRTFPEKSEKLAFLVIGDYGNGKRPQYETAGVMKRVIGERARSDNPIRFVLTTGDNIYADQYLIFLVNSGNRDSHWDRKFFRPYEEVLRSVPFYASPGNHDGGASESPEDLAVYLDNFFFPAPEPSRYYSFRFANLAEFFSLDSTDNTPQRGRRVYETGGEQYRWLDQALSSSTAYWKIAYFHHPPFNAGPGHGPALASLNHYVDLLGRYKVQVAFNGHEHNFQWVEKNELTRGVRYVISGSGGQLRDADVTARLAASKVAAWAPEHHFLLVEIEGKTMRINVLGPRPVRIRDRQGKTVSTPLVVQ